MWFMQTRVDEPSLPVEQCNVGTIQTSGPCGCSLGETAEQLTETLGDPLLDTLAAPETETATVTANIREDWPLGKETAVR
jgi:hypothetical protein